MMSDELENKREVKRLAETRAAGTSIKTNLILTLVSKALRKMEFSKLFVFASFRIIRFLKFGNFSEISGLLELAKILQK